ncbi:MAG: hypothetical protein LC790_08570, partial [Actinobacteria bacterium]|nr:hypothetical protein [Actinomycetota bacterium]
GRVEETKAQVQGRVAETKQDLQDKQQEVVGQTADLARRPTTYWAIAGAAVALLLLGRLRGR